MEVAWKKCIHDMFAMDDACAKIGFKSNEGWQLW